MPHTALQHLDTALDCGARELAALHEGAVETAALLAEQRDRAIALAWLEHTRCEPEAYRTKLRALQHTQTQLSTAAKALHTDIRASLVNSRKESKRLAGYRKTVSYALAT